MLFFFILFHICKSKQYLLPFKINDVQLQEHERGKKNIFCQIWHIEKEKRKMKMMITDDATPYKMKEIYPNNEINATTKKSKNSLTYSFQTLS